MKVLLDTSVLVASLMRTHPMHGAAHAAFVSLSSDERFVSQHSLAELYAIVTRLPFTPVVRADEAARMIHELRQTVQVVPLVPEDYATVIREMGELALSGGVIFDALIARAATKVGADRILTLNSRDFQRVAPDMADRIRSV